jgi:arabinan endo-1,5-alpha-L-arabinosidase
MFHSIGLFLLLALIHQALSSPLHTPTPNLSLSPGWWKSLKELDPSTPPDDLIASLSWPLPSNVTGNSIGWGGIHVHDPSIIFYDGWYYSFSSHARLAIGRAPNLSGPWEHYGSVLNGASIIKLSGRRDPWAPDVHVINDTIYCFYAVNHGGQVSAIGLATSPATGHNFSWVDHGTIFTSGKKTRKIPYNVTNAIDPNLFIDPKTKLPWLQFGSSFSDIWQLPLTPNLSEVAKTPESVHLSQGPILEEGSFMSYHNGWYYLWFDRGRCCFYTSNLPLPGREYVSNSPYT